MSSPLEDLPDIPPAMIDDVKNFMRIEHDQDDLAISGFIRSATSLCENFIGQALIQRTITEMLPVKREWQKLNHLPVQSIDQVARISMEGSAENLSSDAYVLDIDSMGQGWVRLQKDVETSRIHVIYVAGLAIDWDGLPQTLWQGIIRLSGYLYTNRDGVDAGGPPSAVTALWRPHRKMRLT